MVPEASPTSVRKPGCQGKLHTAYYSCWSSHQKTATLRAHQINVMAVGKIANLKILGSIYLGFLQVHVVI